MSNSHREAEKFGCQVCEIYTVVLIVFYYYYLYIMLSLSQTCVYVDRLNYV